MEAAPEPESIPPVGTGQRYSLPFVRYCHFQAERLKTIKPLANGPEDARAYNLLVVDYNARCSDFLYQAQDLALVEAEVSANNHFELARSCHRGEVNITNVGLVLQKRQNRDT